MCTAAGLLPFSAIFIEIFFIMSSVWCDSRTQLARIVQIQIEPTHPSSD